MVEVVDDPLQVTNAVAVAVRKAPGVDLVDDSAPPPVDVTRGDERPGLVLHASASDR